MVGWKINNNSPTIWGFSHVCFLCLFLLGLWCDFLLLGPNFLGHLCLFQTLPSLTPRTATRKICALASHKASRRWHPKMCGRLAGHKSNQREMCWTSGRPWFFCIQKPVDDLCGNLEQLGFVVSSWFQGNESRIILKEKYKNPPNQVIQSDLFIPDRWRSLNHSKWFTNHHPQKGHGLNHQAMFPSISPLRIGSTPPHSRSHSFDCSEGPRWFPVRSSRTYRHQWTIQYISGWWLNQPSWKILAKMGIFTQIGMKIKNIWNHQLDFFLMGKFVENLDNPNYGYCTLSLLRKLLEDCYVLRCFLRTKFAKL